MRVGLTAAALLACQQGGSGLGDGGGLPDGIVESQKRFVDAFPEVPCVSGKGTHRLHLQGRGVDPDDTGRYPLLEDRSALVHGEHFLVSKGSFIEWAAPLCDDVGAHVSFFIPNNEDANDIATAHLELLLVGDDDEQLIAETTDNEQYGDSGYVPYEAEVDGADLEAKKGDLLVLRITIQSDEWYGVVIFNPEDSTSEYIAWIEVEVQ